MSSLRERLLSAIEAWLNSPDDLAANDEMAGQVTDVAMAEVQPELDGKDAEIERLKRELGVADRNETALTTAVQQTDELAADALADAETYAAMARQAEDERDRLRAFAEQMRELAQRITDSDCPGGWGYDIRDLLAALDQPEDQPETP